MDLLARRECSEMQGAANTGVQPVQATEYSEYICLRLIA